MPRCPAPSRQALQVRAHDVGDPIKLGVAPDLVDARPAPLAIPSQDILDSYSHVKQQDLEAVFAFVRDCMKDKTFIMQAAAESGQVPA